MANHEEEKPDGLEIHAIGKLYNGPWHKKYWSSSRGKDRHPYPVGYKVVRTQNQNVYTMEILEGLRGPIFMISSIDGHSCSGQTPDIVWDSFQKKGCARVKLGHRKRLSCKIDGVELFGFKNRSVQRLLRELLSSSSNSGVSGSRDNPQCTKCCRAPCTCPNYQPDRGKPLVTRKVQVKNEVINLKSNKHDNLEQPPRGVKAHIVDVRKSGQHRPRHFSNGNPSTESTLKEEKTDLETVIEDGNCSVLGEYDLQTDSTNSFKHLKQAKDVECNHSNSRCSTAKEEPIAFIEYKELSDRSIFTSTQGFNFPKEVEEARETFVPKDSQTINYMDLLAHDTSDVQHDGNYDIVMDIPKEGPFNIKDVLNASNMLIVEDSEDESHVISTENGNTEKCDTDSVGVDSMMKILLPWAVPLLRSSRKKRKRLRSQGEKERRNVSVDVHCPATELLTENHFKKTQMNKANTPRINFGSVLPSSEDSAYVVPDSFENDQCNHSTCGERSCVPESIRLYAEGISQQGHTSITNICPDIELVMGKGHEGKDNLIAGFTSTNRNDMCTGLHDSYVHRGSQSEQKYEGAILAMSTSPTGKLCFDNTLQEELSPKTGEPCTSNMPTTTFPDIANLSRPHNPPQSERSLDSIIHETSLDVLSQNLLKDKSSTNSEDAFCYMVPDTSDEETSLPSRDNCFADACNSSISRDGKSYNKELFGLPGSNELNFSKLRLQDKGAKSSNKTENNTIDCSNLNNSTDVKHNCERADIFELLGCYVHPMPISIVLMRTKGNDMYVCVLCGYHMGKNKSVFIYKVPVKGKGRGCPSIIGHASLLSPYLYALGREILLDGSSMQLTPDGQYLVLHNSIKAPYCSVGNAECPCLVCTSACFEANAVKIVEVKRGYVSTAIKLKTTDSVCCILVCEPCYLLAAEERGRLKLWTMNSSWTDTTKRSYLPTSNCMPGRIVQMKRIPKSGLVAGQNAFGEFCLWDITRQMLVGKFSAPQISVFRFLPISLIRFPSTGFSTAGIDSEEYINGIGEEETNMWSSTNGDDVAVCLLILSVNDPDARHCYQSNNGVNPVGRWSLALLARKTMILGNTLDPRASVVGASVGYGIMSTCDKLLYMWELSKGRELGALHYCKGAQVSYIGADDSDSGAYAIGYDGGQLQVYMPSANANQEER